ncbi:MAG: peptide chain release factor N(5)-glutamine methyltransferase [Gammaproteobacteria bacterium]|nr:peptide chain release factor N(5)-glutamine methyltransferase [Gammaproteobacteria bacterium]
MKSGAEKSTLSSIAGLLLRAQSRLAHLDNSRLDAELLLTYATQQTRSWLHTWPERSVDDDVVQLFDELVERRASGVPLAYLRGQWDFWSLTLQVNNHTLVPRPETEHLVELTLSHAADASVIIDLGTGCGAIALALASELRDKSLIATDVSAEALAVAKNNALALQSNVEFVQCDWLTGLSNKCSDIVVSNPPYIACGDEHLVGDGVAFEPALALVGGTDGLDAYRQIIPQASRCLRPGGWLLLEHGHDQAAAVCELLSGAGYANIVTQADIARLDRVTTARRI